MDKWTEGKKRK